MVGKAPETGNWKAREDRQPPGVKLTVTGDVTTTRSNQTPKLTKVVPVGINPTILEPQLTIEETGIGSDIIGKREARYLEQITAGQYATIHILWEREKIAQIDHVEVVH